MTARCFVAVEPPPSLVRKLEGLERPERKGLRWTPPDQWHLTLRFFAAIDPAELVGALDDASRRTGGFATGPVIARGGPRPERLGDRVWVLPVAGVDALAATVTAVTPPAPPDGGPEHRPFRGHLTLARARHPGVLRRLPRPEVTDTWPVEQVVAYRSELGPDRAHHYLLGRWPLIAR